MNTMQRNGRRVLKKVLDHFLMTRRSSSLDLKVVILGSAFVGKTSLINRYCNGTFQDETLSTIGAGFFTHTLNLDGTEVTMMLWDTAGEERFRSVAPSLLRGANGLVLVFDVTSVESFKSIDIYMDMFLDTCSVNPNTTMPVLLLGNKTDLAQFCVTEQMIEDWKKKNRVAFYYPVSAKTGSNVSEAFETFVKELVSPAADIDNQPIQIVINTETTKTKKGCCS